MPHLYMTLSFTSSLLHFMHKNILWVGGKSAASFLITIFSFPPPSSCPPLDIKNTLISQSNIMHLNDDLFLRFCEVSLVTSRCDVALRFLISRVSKEYFFAHPYLTFTYLTHSPSLICTSSAYHTACLLFFSAVLQPAPSSIISISYLAFLFCDSQHEKESQKCFPVISLQPCVMRWWW